MSRASQIRERLFYANACSALRAKDGQIVAGRYSAVSLCPAMDGMQTLLQLHLFKQEIRYQAAKT
jgi:hypothetical protein